MKKSASLLLLVLISLLCHATEITQTYYFNNPEIRTLDGYQVVIFENTLLTGITGEPSIPYKDIRLLLPPGEEAISVNISYEEETPLEGFFQLYPRQASQPISLGKTGVFHKNEAVYQGQNPYPAERLGHYTSQFLHGHSILLSSFTPVKYIPATGKVSYYAKVTVSVSTRETSRAEAAVSNLGRTNTLPLISRFVENMQMMSLYPEKDSRDDEYNILIISRQQFEGEFNEYLSLYLKRGMKAEVATIENISAAMTGNDLQEKIRNFIIQEYQEKGIEYVLLGGDVEHVPYRGFYCYVQSGSGYTEYDIPSDLYYSALDGSWNDNNNNMWGEIGEEDLLPEVSVARWPFSTSNQLQRLLHKTTLYQDAPVTGELQRHIMAGEYLWSDPETYGCDYLELLVGHHEDNGYTTDGIPETDDILWMCEPDMNWDKYDLMNAVNEGRSFIHHSGHASNNYVMYLSNSDITNNNFSGANGVDHNYSLVYTHGCLCGAFDDSDCIAEAMVCIDNFAAAGAFNSRYGWFNEGQTEGPSAHLHREFVDALYDQQENRIGNTHRISKINTSTWVNAPGQWEEGALRWCFYDCNILGDPAMAIWTREPISIDVEYPDELVTGTTSFTVTVTSQGNAAEGMMCVLMSGDQMCGSCLTDISGQAVIQIPGGFNGTEAELVVSGYQCLPHYYPVNVVVGINLLTGDDFINIYPVPFNDKLNIALNPEQLEETQNTFLLSDGKILGNYRIPGHSNQKTFNIDTSQWPSGIIIIKIISGNQLTLRKLIHIN